MIFMSPGGAKSFYTSVMIPPFYMGTGPRRRIIAGSHSIDLAKDFGGQARGIAADPQFAATFGERIKVDKGATGDWMLTNNSRYYAAGVGTGIAGRRATLGLIDDPLKSAEAANSLTQRDRIYRWYVNDFRTRLIPGAPIICIGTRWHYDDLFGRILPADYDFRSGPVVSKTGETWEVICIPALIETEEQAALDPLGRKLGESFWPEWFSADFLKVEKAQRSPWEWSSLYQQRPTPEEGAFFQRSWFRWYDKAPPRSTLVIYGASDYAVTADGGDWTVHLVVGVDPEDNIYVLDLWRAQTETDVWIEMLLSLWQVYGPREWAEEKGPIHRSVDPFIKKRQVETGLYTYRRPFPTMSDKASRAQAIRGRTAMGKVYLPKNAPWVTGFLSELLTFPMGVNDDQVDAFGLIGMMLPRMSRGRNPPPAPPPMRGIDGATMERLWDDQERDQWR